MLEVKKKKKKKSPKTGKMPESKTHVTVFHSVQQGHL